jgi:hypothetical protein
MDSVSIITLIIIVLVSILLIFITKINASKKKRIFFQEFTNYVEQLNCKISEHELFNNILIGFDKDNRKLFFMKKLKNINITKEINLDEIQRCRFVNTSKSVKTGSGSQTIIEKLELSFIHNIKTEPAKLIEFYNADLDHLTLNGEIEFIEKWKQIINDFVSKTKK